ncbi:ethylbenzene dehydrogenase-related protein [Geobacter pickeringii]|nr:ethylbenzene dehydrogenase-related protein [Geobacter pickeringii]
MDRSVFLNGHKFMCLTLALMAFILLPSTGRSADLTVVKVAGITNGLDPADPAWGGVASVPLALQNRMDWPDRHVFPTTAPRIFTMKAIHDGTTIYFRFEWSDSSQNTTITDVPTYPDGCAIMFPMWDWTNPCTPAFADNMFMGFFQWNPLDFVAVLPPYNYTTCTPPYNLVTNIIMWKANLKNKPQNLMAMGELGTVHKTGTGNGTTFTNQAEGVQAPSTPALPLPRTPPATASAFPAPTLAPVPSQNITSSQRWAAGVWTVIIKRPMSSADPNAQFDFANAVSRTGIPFALANWDGQLQERANRKFATADWLRMDIQP